MKKASHRAVYKRSFPGEQEGRSCGHALLSGTCLFSADREQKGQSVLTRRGRPGESAALAVGLLLGAQL